MLKNALHCRKCLTFDKATIRKTFSDFRRTHSDTWHEDITKFTEDQLSLLSDMLISPSYYA